MSLRVISLRWWTPRELEQRKLIPRDRVVRAVRRGELPAVVLDGDEDVLIELREVNRWLFDERAAGETWVGDYWRYRQTEDGRSMRQPRTRARLSPWAMRTPSASAQLRATPSLTPRLGEEPPAC